MVGRWSQTDIDVSPYKYQGPGGAGREAWVHEAPMPDPYRGLHPGFTAESGAAYAHELEVVLAALDQQGRAPAAFICEPIMSCAGQIEPPPTFLSRSFDAVRRDSKQPAPDVADYLVNRLRDQGVLLSTDGPDHNVIKIKPPLVFGSSEAAHLIERLDATIAELD